MADGKLVWSDPQAWQEQFFPGAKRRGTLLPPGYVSHARRSWDDELHRREQGDDAERASVVAHVRQLREQEQVERWKALVMTFGSVAVETIVKRTDPGFRLPDDLRDIAGPTGNATPQQED